MVGSISDKKTAEMQANAASPGMSLSQMFQQQYDRQYGIQKQQDAAMPKAEEAVKAVGDFRDRAPGQNPLDIAKQGMGLRDAIGKIRTNTDETILSTLTSMMNLQKQESDAKLAAQRLAMDQEELKLKKQQMQAELAAKNLILDEATGGVRGMTPAEIKEKGVDASGLDPSIAAYVTMFKNGSMKKISEIPAAERGLVVTQLASKGIDLEELARQREGKGVAGTIQQLFDLYYGKTDKGDDLAKGRFMGTASKALAAVGLDTRVKNFEDFKKGILASLKSVTGDTGILTDQDAARIEQWIPSPTLTEEEANGNWGLINNLLKNKYGISLDTTANPAISGDRGAKAKTDSGYTIVEVK